MKSTILSGLFLSSLMLACAGDSVAEDTYTRTEDVIYGRKYGTALTLDVFAPKDVDGQKPNGAAVIFAVSGGFFSSHDAINFGLAKEFLKRGYTVFAVVHGSQPKFTIPEILEDMHRAVRFIRSRADQYQIDRDRIGICGASAGGHLSLMQGTAGTLGDSDAKDPVERESSRVQAVACFFPPTDFMNYGKTGEIALGTGVLRDFRAPFDFHEFDQASKSFVPISDVIRRNEIGRQISPMTHVTHDDAPSLIIHGDADRLVPYQQAVIIIKKMRDVGVPCELVTKVGADHGWAGLDKDFAILANWFDQYLAKK